MQPHFFIVYDGIQNSVFISQVVHPLIAQLEKDLSLSAHIVSFERTRPASIPSLHSRLTIHIAHKIPFLGTISLWYAARQLKSILSPHASYSLTARGPLAGFIARTAQTAGCTKLIIQARGLAAEEYRYTHVKKSNRWFMNILYRIRATQYESLEANIFGPGETKGSITIQAVSLALKEYLVTNFDTNRARITIAEHDSPAPIGPSDKIRWRSARRTELNIDPNALVYCYSGSAKSWQCPEKVISYFKDCSTQNSQAILLILTTDISIFAELLATHAIDSRSYRMICAKPEMVCEYLCASDVGLLFRDPHPLNWVSRPTKALEYHAAGLRIEHNNTIAMLCTDATQL